MKGSVTKRQGKRGPAWQLKWELPRDPLNPDVRRFDTKTVRVKNKGDAEDELRKILHSLDTGSYVEPQSDTLASFIALWLTRPIASPDGQVTQAKRRRKITARTFEGYKTLLENHVVPHIGAIALQKLTAARIDDLYETLRNSGRRKQNAGESAGLSETTVLHVHRVLNLVLKAATRKRLISRNPMDDLDAETKPTATSADDGQATETIKALERHQLDALLHGFRGNRLFPLVALAAGTGARRGELLALRWSDIDFEKSAIKIGRAIEDTVEHGQREKAPKTKGSKRTIGIDAGLAALLAGHRRQQQEDALKLGTREKLAPENLLFPQSALEPNTFLRPGYVSKEFGVHAKRIGLAGVRFHDLRHTHATQLLEAGVPIHAVARRLGHSTPVITLKVYAHALRDSEEQAIAVSGELLRKTLAGA